eukprot:m.74182 g.74182  ORF g.74182 m.74182 type:complete len:70 (-) comp10278_c0_seq1:134-343(-)
MSINSSSVIDDGDAGPAAAAPGIALPTSTSLVLVKCRSVVIKRELGLRSIKEDCLLNFCRLEWASTNHD